MNGHATSRTLDQTEPDPNIVRLTVLIRMATSRQRVHRRLRGAEHRQPRVALLLLNILADQSPDAATRLAARDLVQKLENARTGQ